MNSDCDLEVVWVEVEEFLQLKFDCEFLHIPKMSFTILFAHSDSGKLPKVQCSSLSRHSQTWHLACYLPHLDDGKKRKMMDDGSSLDSRDLGKIAKRALSLPEISLKPDTG